MSVRHWPGPSYHHVMRFPPDPPGYKRDSTQGQGVGAFWVVRDEEGDVLDIGIAMEPLFPQLEGNRALRLACAGVDWALYDVPGGRP